MRTETDEARAEEKRRQEERKMSQRRRAGTAFHQEESVFCCDPTNAIPPDPWTHTPQSEKCHQDAWWHPQPPRYFTLNNGVHGR